jgi:hypothetical protein
MAPRNKLKTLNLEGLFLPTSLANPRFALENLRYPMIGRKMALLGTFATILII